MTENELIELCKEVLDNNPDKVNNYKLGKKNLIAFFLGLVMKKLENKGEPGKILRILDNLLNGSN